MREILKENAFLFHRNVRHGELWVDNYGKTICLAREHAGRNVQNFLSQLRRATKDRPKTKEEDPVTPFNSDSHQTKEEKPTEMFDYNENGVKSEQMKPENGENNGSKLKSKPKKERETGGKKIIERLNRGDFPLLTREDLFDLLKALEYKNCYQQLVSFSKKVTSIKDGSGVTYYESREIWPFIRERVETSLAKGDQKQLDAPSGGKISLPAFARALYEQLAEQEGVTIEEIFSRVLTKKAAQELQALAKNFRP